MPYFLLALGLIIGGYAFYRFFLNANTRQIIALLLTVIAAVMSIAIILLALTGRLPAAIAIVIALWPIGIAMWKKHYEKVDENDAVSTSDTSLSEALEILGVTEDASLEDIEAAYKRLMKKVHPDQEGSEGLAKQLNEAKDLLIKEKNKK